MNSFDNKGRKVCCKVSLYKNCQRQSCSAVNCLSIVINILAAGRPFPLKSCLQVIYPLLKAASFDTFCLVAPQPQEIDTGFPTSHQPRFYAAHNFLKMGTNYLNLSSFGQFRQYRTKSLLQSFSGRVVAQSIAFRVVSIFWQGVTPFP